MNSRTVHIALGAWLFTFVLYMLVFWAILPNSFLKTAIVGSLAGAVVSLLAGALHYLTHPTQNE
ncbi:MAG: hypothetical protein U1A23_02830 [Candidatus Sungbacteria bacterium]|nr:hypothetical protein [bacterium]MDZ4285838.1 hypothetical protein [Candidatus Sungbacteria bacterium]